MAVKTAGPPRPGAPKRVPDEERGPTLEERFAAFSARYKWFFFIPILAGIAVAIILAVGAGHRRHLVHESINAARSARTVEELDALSERYPGTFAGKRALARAGDLLYDQGRYAEARAKYEAYLATKPDPALGMPVRMALVQTYIAQGEFERGIEACTEILGLPGREYVEAQVTYYRAYCYELAGDLKRAGEEYDKVMTMEQSLWAPFARDRKDEIARKIRAESTGAEKTVDTTGGS